MWSALSWQVPVDYGLEHSFTKILSPESVDAEIASPNRGDDPQLVVKDSTGEKVI